MRGVYKCCDSNGEVVYIGSTSLSLNRLEYNHRNWQQKGYSRTKFRSNLDDSHTFSWLLMPRDIPVWHNEIEEGALIRAFRPKYNISMFPFERSVNEGRYKMPTAEGYMQ